MRSKNRLPLDSNHFGFTLLELLISIMIMAVISTLTATGIQNSVKNKVKVQKQLEYLSAVRDSLKIMETDVRRAFHHQDFNKEMIEKINKKRRAGKTKQSEPPDSFQIKVPNYPNLTEFIGDKDQLHFTNLNHVRSERDALESFQQEVGYFLKDCQSRGGKKKSQCLWRRVSAFIDDDVTKGGEDMVLAENVVDFKLRYLGPGRDDWVDNWKSDQRGDAISRENFPFAVEVTLSIQDQEVKGDKKISMTMVTPIDFPNNKESKNGSDSTEVTGGWNPLQDSKEGVNEDTDTDTDED